MSTARPTAGGILRRYPQGDSQKSRQIGGIACSDSIPIDSVLHCFINEYIYFEDDDENLLVCDLELEIASAIANSQQPRLSDLSAGFLPPSAHLRLVQ